MHADAACTQNLLIHDEDTTVVMCVKQKLGRTTKVWFQPAAVILITDMDAGAARPHASREAASMRLIDACQDFQDVYQEKKGEKKEKTKTLTRATLMQPL